MFGCFFFIKKKPKGSHTAKTRYRNFYTNQKWNWVASFPIFTFMYPWEYLNPTQIHECGNWERGRAQIHFWEYINRIMFAVQSCWFLFQRENQMLRQQLQDHGILPDSSNTSDIKFSLWKFSLNIKVNQSNIEMFILLKACNLMNETLSDTKMLGNLRDKRCSLGNRKIRNSPW